MTHPEANQFDGYQPGLKDKDTVKFLLDSMFLGVEPTLKSERGTQLKGRTWRGSNDAVFNAAITQPAGSTGVDQGILTMLRKTVAPDGLTELRVYEYFIETGQLQVANELYTPDDIIFHDHNKDSRRALTDKVIEGLIQKIYTPTQVEYLEFLEDTDSFQRL